MKEIKLTQGQVTIVDDEEFEKLNRFKWHAQKEGRKFRAGRSVTCGNKRKTLLMHRIILNAPAGMEVDHINGNPLDNRRTNLRLATAHQNRRNHIGPNKNNKLGIKGVYWYKRYKKYQVTIGFNNKRIYIGYFTSLSDADKAYRDAEVTYFGNFARGNN